MPLAISKNHPKLLFVFRTAPYIKINDEMSDSMENFVDSLHELRPWLNGAPKFFDEEEDPNALDPGEVPIRAIGGYIEIYSTVPPLTLPREVERQLFREIEALIEAVGQYSAKKKLVIEFELDRELIGEVDHGQMDKLLEIWPLHAGLVDQNGH